jgi:hypothetical protein
LHCYPAVWNKSKFNSSAQAMFLKGTKADLRFPKATYSTSLAFPVTFFLIFVNCTFTMTAPSFRCKFTFFPRKDLAVFKLKFSIQVSPLNFFLSNRRPTLLANGQFFSFKQNVQLYVLAFAVMLPRILTMFQTCNLQDYLMDTVCTLLLLSQMEQLTHASGERCVKVKLYTSIS